MALTRAAGFDDNVQALPGGTLPAAIDLTHEAQRQATRWRFLLSPQAAWAAMMDDCKQAQQSIEFEQYIFRPDRIGKRFFAVFRKKAREGVQVKLLFDMFGSIQAYFSPAIKLLRDDGVKIYFYRTLHPFDIVMPWKWLPRSHAKTMLIDSHISYTGGVCFSEDMRHWRDTHVRVEGPMKTQVRAAFDRLWARFEHKGAWWPRHRFRLHNEPAANQAFRFLTSRPGITRNPIYRELREQVKAAKHSVRIASAYFIPTYFFLRLLRKKAREGVRVSVLISEKSDVPFADLVAASYFPRMLRAGIEVHLYKDTVFHGKVMLTDDRWATVGSMNLDYLSLFQNRETNLIITDEAATAELAQQFERDIACSRPVTWEYVRAIPNYKKIIGRAARLLRRFL